MTIGGSCYFARPAVVETIISVFDLPQPPNVQEEDLSRLASAQCDNDIVACALSPQRNSVVTITTVLTYKEIFFSVLGLMHNTCLAIRFPNPFIWLPQRLCRDIFLPRTDGWTV